MRFPLLPLLAALLALSGCLSSTEPHPGTPAEPASTEPAGNHTSPYLDREHSPIRGLTEQEILDLENGAGAGFAIPAELNGYPGPRHLLDMKGELELTPTQVDRLEALFKEMNAAAKRGGQTVLAAHADLESAFRDGAVNETRLRELVDALHEATADLRFVHLQAHLTAKDLVTPQQVARYNELRGYGNPSGSASHEGHGGHQGHG